jgi:hypothetical protein
MSAQRGHRFMYAAVGVHMFAFLVSFAACDARAQSVAFTAHGTILHTGNSLSLSGQTSANGPGTTPSGHTLVSLDSMAVDSVPANAANPWFAGTTASYLLDGSAAVLNIPAQATILHAELIWGGSYNYGGENLTSAIDGTVTFGTPVGASVAVSPDPSWSRTINQLASGGFTAAYYVRAADVTALVASAGEGTYKVSGVPVTQSETINGLNGGGWALVVVAEYAQAPCRSLSVQSVGAWIDENQSADVAFANLSTPPSGAVSGRAVVGAIAGDASSTGDNLLILMPGTSNYLPLSGPNNAQNNFFASQINDGDGLLDTSGTFGTRNHNAAGTAQTIGGRQGWDLTAIALDSASGELAPAQAAATLRFLTTGDAYVATFAGFEADSAGSCPAPPGDGIFADEFEAK